MCLVLADDEGQTQDVMKNSTLQICFGYENKTGVGRILIILKIC